MKLPRKLKVGHRVYTVQQPPAAWIEETGNHGLCDTDAHVLTVARHPNTRQRANTLLHETLHAVFEAANLRSTAVDRHEELIVSALANGLCDVLADNPALLAALRDGLSEKV